MHILTAFAQRSPSVRRIVPIVAGVAVLAALTGCSSRTAVDASSTSAASAAAGATATSGATGSRGATNFSTVTIVTPATESDHGWNQMGLAGASAAAKGTDLKLTADTNVGYDNTLTILTQAAQKSGVGFVIAHASGFGQAAAQANAKTGVPFLITDVPKAQVKNKIGVITFSAQQGGYLAGIAAAMTTKTKKLGIAVSADDVNWFTMSGGFIAGARSVNPSIRVDVAYIGAAAYDDSAGGKKVVQQLIASGDDIIFGMGDGATVGYVAAVDEANQAGNAVKYIADIGDVSDLMTNKDEVLTSVLWQFEGAYTSAIKDIKAGKFATAPYNLDLKNGGIKLQTTTGMTSAITAITTKAQAGIEGGTITVPNTGTKAELTALLK